MVAVGSYLVSASQYPAGCSFEAVDERAQGDLGRVGGEQVHVVVFPVEFDEFAFEVSAYLVHDLFHVFEHGLGEYSSTVFRHKDQMGLEIVNACAAVSEFIRILHRPNGIIGGMEQTVRYRYRVYPTAVQEQSLKRLFGCCRVVWNDTVYLFRELFDPNGRMPSSSALQKKVLADAKRTEERAWLAEVANVPLLQMHRDALQACWNGVRKTRRQRRARYRSLKRNPVNSARFTANEFRLRDNGRLYLAKIGDMKVRWSRDLPSTPSSCTIIREPDGAWYVSFVVRRETTPLPEIPVSNAIDLGFTHLGSLIDTDGNRRRIPAPKPLNQTQRRLAKAQRKEARQQQSSKRYQKQKQRIARLYAKARHQLDDYQNKQALRIVRETQAIGLETLNVHGMSRIHGRSMLTVAPSRFVMKLEHKAQQYGRQIRHIGRFQPSTRLCSQCGHHVKGGIPENIRVWKCAECHTILDRDYNAALNILDAAGLAESLNARGDSVRLHLATAGRSNSQRNANHRHHTDAGIPML